jgi:hypothetical protein
MSSFEAALKVANVFSENYQKQFVVRNFGIDLGTIEPRSKLVKAWRKSPRDGECSIWLPDIV